MLFAEFELAPIHSTEAAKASQEPQKKTVIKLKILSFYKMKIFILVFKKHNTFWKASNIQQRIFTWREASG